MLLATSAASSRAQGSTPVASASVATVPAGGSLFAPVPQDNGGETSRGRATPTPERTRFLVVSRGTEHACGLTADGKAYCWGSNRLGQLGDDATANRPSASAAVATTQVFVTISAGANHTCALTRDGAAYCWGLNFTGELGQAFVANVCGGFPCNRRPARVETNVTFDTVSAGFGHTCALSDGRAFCWGRNDRGQLGSSRAEDLCEGVACNVSPVRVTGVERFTSISAGGDHTCGIADGIAYCWGSNQYGQLGVAADVANSARPLRVNVDQRVRAIDAHGIRTCVTTERGERRCWGRAERDN